MFWVSSNHSRDDRRPLPEVPGPAFIMMVEGRNDLSDGAVIQSTPAIPSQAEIEADSGTLPGLECQVQDIDNTSDDIRWSPGGTLDH